MYLLSPTLSLILVLCSYLILYSYGSPEWFVVIYIQLHKSIILFLLVTFPEEQNAFVAASTEEFSSAESVRRHWELDFKSCYIKPNLDCNYTIPKKGITKVSYKSKFV